MTTNTKAIERRKGKRTLPLLNAKSDHHVWAAIWAMKRRGDVTNQVPDYELIQVELKKLGFPEYGNKQISRCVGRLKTLGYIRTHEEFAGLGEQPEEVLESLMESIA